MFPFWTRLKVFYKKQCADMFKPRYVPNEGVFTDLRDATYFKENTLFSIKRCLADSAVLR